MGLTGRSTEDRAGLLCRAALPGTIRRTSMAQSFRPRRTARSALLAAALGLVSFGASAPARAQTFPADAAWKPMLRAGVPVADPAGDAPTGRDVVGVSTQASAAAYFSGDASFLYFRLRINDAVLQVPPADYKAFGWVCLFDTDGNLLSHELSLGVDGVSNVVELRQNTTPLNNGSPGDVSELLVKIYPTTTHARSIAAATTTSGNPDVFLDWAVARADLVPVGVGPLTPFRLVCGSSNNAQSLTADLVSDTGAVTVGGLATDPVACDGSTCFYACPGLGQPCTAGTGACIATGTIQCNGQTPYCDAFSDEPGTEVCNGTDDDCDGSVDEDFGLDAPCSVGVGACTASGVVVCTADEMASECSAKPGDPVPEACNAIDDDCDGAVDNGFGLGSVCTVGVGACLAMGVVVCDGLLGATCNVMPGAPSSETCNGVDDDCNGTTDEGCADSDGDGLSDATEIMIGTDPADADSDDDGVSDGAEVSPAVDTDGDGLDNGLDPDSDGDGIFDGTEMGYGCDDPATNPASSTCVPDGDLGATTTDPTKADTDGGGKADGLEDIDHDGVVDAGETNPNDPSDDDLSCFADVDCGNPVSGMVCDAGACVPGCRGAEGNACPYGEVCSSTDASIGVCTDAPNECAQDADCGAADSGRVCDIAARLCQAGCRGAAGNGCPAGSFCVSETSALGLCAPEPIVSFEGNGVFCAAARVGRFGGFGPVALVLGLAAFVARRLCASVRRNGGREKRSFFGKIRG